jgi:hypothetical protein
VLNNSSLGLRGRAHTRMATTMPNQNALFGSNQCVVQRSLPSNGKLFARSRETGRALFAIVEESAGEVCGMIGEVSSVFYEQRDVLLMDNSPMSISLEISRRFFEGKDCCSIGDDDRSRNQRLRPEAKALKRMSLLYSKEFDATILLTTLLC